MKLTLASPLFALLPADEQSGSVARHAVMLEASTWDEAVTEIRGRFPDLAQRVFVDGTAVAPGFILVVNDTVMPRGAARVNLQPGDELSLLAGIAGGR